MKKVKNIAAIILSFIVFSITVILASEVHFSNSILQHFNVAGGFIVIALMFIFVAFTHYEFYVSDLAENKKMQEIHEYKQTIIKQNKEINELKQENKRLSSK